MDRYSYALLQTHPVQSMRYLVLVAQLLVWDVGRKIGVQQSAECQSIIPTAAEIRDINILQSKDRVSPCTIYSSLWGNILLYPGLFCQCTRDNTIENQTKGSDKADLRRLDIF